MRCYFKFFLSLLVYCVLANTAFASAHDYVIERAYVEDPSNHLTLAQVMQHAANPFQGILARGYSKSSFWIKIKVDAAPSLALKNAHLTLRIEPGYLDEVELFDPLEPAKKNRFAGDRHTWNQYEYQSLLFNFLIPASNQPRDVWLRLKTTSTNMIYVRAFDPEGLQKTDLVYQVLAGVLIIASFLFVVWGMFNFAINRDFLIGIFTIKQLVGFFFVASFVGYFRLFLSDYFSANSLDIINNALIFSTTLSTALFHYLFFKDYQPKWWVQYFFKAVVVMLAVEIAFIASGDLTSALRLNMGVLTLIGPFMMLVVLFGINWRALGDSPLVMPRSILIIFHMMYLLIALATALPSMGFAPLTNFAPHVAMVYWFLTGVATILMLQYRARRVYEEQRLMIGVASREAELQRQQREEERRFLEMLTHELRTSLSVIRMAIGTGGMDAKYKAHADNAILDVSQVMERCLQVQEAGDGKLALHKEHVSIETLLGDLILQYAERADIRLEAPESSNLYSDVKLLKVLLSNLIDNAVKYGAAKQPILVHVSRVDASFLIEVVNEAGVVGMPDPDRVFEKYYRAAHAHGIIGSGLGLYLMKNIARLLGGDLLYLPSENRVKFVLSLAI
jgi:signal transduction histidine kinase